MKYVRAHLGLPPTKVFFMWGDLSSHLSEWIQASDMWRVVIYGHACLVRQNARTISVEKFMGVFFPPGSHCSHFKIGKGTPIATANFDLPGTGKHQYAIPTIFDSSESFLDQIIYAGESALDGAERGKALLWNHLWTIAEPCSVMRDAEGIYLAEEFIRTNLGNSFSIPELASQVGVPPRTLLSWFQAEHRQSIQGFIKETRAREACRLLAESQLGIKEIAKNVGVRDLQQFNKLVHGYAGLSPRSYRNRMQSIPAPEVTDIINE